MDNIPMWSMDFGALFDNYENCIKWGLKRPLAGLIFGDRSFSTITNVFFSTISDFNAAVDRVQFIENSLISNITFLGVMSLNNESYPFALSSLHVLMENNEQLLEICASALSLETRNFRDIFNLNAELVLNSFIPENTKFIARTFMTMNLCMKTEDNTFFVDEISKAFAAELEYIDSLLFTSTKYGLFLDDNPQDVSPHLYSSLLNESVDCYNKIKCVDFTALVRVSKHNDNDELTQKLVPIVKIRKGFCVYRGLKTVIPSVTILYPDFTSETIVQRLRTSLKRAVSLVERCAKNYSDHSRKMIVEVDINTFLISDNLVMVVQPRLSKEVLSTYRRELHKIFNLESHKPRIRPSQSVSFHQRRLLRNPHEHISNYEPKGIVSVVRGFYDYHHYLQDSIDDRGWGCAYRSFQTIWSWLRLQGYVDKGIPSHREIQQNLHENGDKDASFVGSRQWIGSIELGYCLESMANISSRIITTNSGTEVADNARIIARHFQTQGSPVMIGGGMLAHTILGIDFNDTTGESMFLVLDPHYTGGEDIKTVISKGWCGWKLPSFWQREHFYNLLLPIPPIGVI